MTEELKEPVSKEPVLKEPAKKRPGRPKGSKNKAKESDGTAKEKSPKDTSNLSDDAVQDMTTPKSKKEKTSENKETDSRFAVNKAADKKASDKEAADKKAADKKVIEEKALEKNDVAKRSVEKNASDKKTVEKKAEDKTKKGVDEKSAEVGGADQKASATNPADTGETKQRKRRGRPPRQIKQETAAVELKRGGENQSESPETENVSVTAPRPNGENEGEKQGTTVYVNTLVGMIPVEKKDPKKNGRKRNGKPSGLVQDTHTEVPSAQPTDVVSEEVQRAEELREASSAEEEADTETKEAEREINGIPVDGIFEYADSTSNTGYGFLRKFGISTEMDIYVSPMFTKKFGLKNGEHVRGYAKKDQGNEKYRALVYVSEVNGMPPYQSRHKNKFDDMTPLFPKERLNLSKNNSDIAMRIIDLIAPVGKGQRGLIVAPPKSGKTILLQKIAKAIRDNYPEIELMILLIDERPEEVTDMKEEVQTPVYYSTFDELPQNHIRVAELVLNRARGLVEMGKDVVILLDSITRLARAYNIALPASGRTLSGGLDTNALHKPKRFLGSARNMQEGGSLTILATALIETGSKMDDVIFEEFKGTGNLELILDRKLSERRIFPSIDIKRSGTRREERLLGPEEYEAVLKLRRALDQNSTNEPVELLSEELMKTKNNEELVKWINKFFLK